MSLARIFYLFSLLLLAYWPEQGDFYLIFPLYSVGFALYFWVLWRAERGLLTDRSFFVWMWTAVLVRLLLLPLVPGLSDDVYRFIWDGRLGVQGLDVLAHLPVWYMQEGQGVEGLTEELFAQLNSPEYFTIYPPLAQEVFKLAAYWSPQSIWGSMVLIRLFLLVCEWGSLLLLPQILRKLQLPVRRTLVYSLNPLVVVEITGNLHFEGAMVFFFLLFVWFFLEARLLFSAWAFALSVASKLLSLMFLPALLFGMWGGGLAPNAFQRDFFGKNLGKGRVYIFSLFWFSALFVLLGFLFWPFVGGLGAHHFGESLDLYFRRFEFNASVYYVLRWLRYLQLGYNDIHRLGPLLGLLAGLGILVLAWWRRRGDFSVFLETCFWSFLLYLFFATTVHPWYLSFPVLLAVFFRRSPPYFALWWSYAVSWTYINYSYPVYRENLWVVALEYLSVLLVWRWERAGGSACFAPVTKWLGFFRHFGKRGRSA